MRSVRVSPFVLPICLVLSTSCESAPARTSGVHAPETPLTDRVSDGLLHNPTLQQVVDAQTARDIEALQSFFDHDDPLVRARAAFGAGSVQAPMLAAPLRRLLADSDPRVRADAAFALGQIGDTAARVVLSKALKKETEVTAQSRIIEALGRVGTRASLTELAAMDPTRAVAPSVALAIARLGARDIHDPVAIEWVAERLTAGEPSLRMNAAYYFGRTPSSRPWSLHAAYVRDALEDYALDEAAAMYVVLGLGRFHGADGRLLLHRLENAVDWRVRANTASALAPLSSDERVLEGLMDALDDPNPHVAANAAAALDWSEILETSHLDAIERWIARHPQFSTVHATLLGVLANRERGDAVLRIAQEIRESKESAVALMAPAVGMVQSEEAFLLLAELANSEAPEVRHAALEAISDRWARWRGAIDGTAVFNDVLSDVLRDAGDQDVLAAASVLVDPAFADEDTSELLVATYERLVHEKAAPGVVLQYVRLLGTMEDTNVQPALERGAEHEHPTVRRAAAEALAKMTGTRPTVDQVSTHTPTTVSWAELVRWGPRPQIRLETTQGDVIVELAAEQAPRTVQHFIELVMKGSYNDTPFHRVVPNFAIQTGTELPANGTARHADMVSEFTRIPFSRGVLGMANSGKDTESTEFFITHSMQPHLDGHYTAFGQVIHGLDVIDRITTQDVIVSASLIEEDLSS